MKATGEVMSIDRTFESALLKALTSIEIKCDGLHIPFVSGLNDADLVEKLKACDDERIFCIAEVMRRELMTVEDLYNLTKIDRWFLNKIRGIIDLENRLQTEPLTKEMVYEAESRGFTDTDIITLSGTTRDVLQDIRVYNDIYPVYKMVDTCAAEFEASTPYYYSVYGDEGTENEAIATPDKKKILVLGSGPIRIGQGIEFIYQSS